MESVAEPPDSATGEPELVPSIANWTVPVGVPAVEVTVAVNVTESPNIDVFSNDDDNRVVVVSDGCGFPAPVVTYTTLESERSFSPWVSTTLYPYTVF